MSNVPEGKTLKKGPKWISSYPSNWATRHCGRRGLCNYRGGVLLGRGWSKMRTTATASEGPPGTPKPPEPNGQGSPCTHQLSSEGPPLLCWPHPGSDIRSDWELARSCHGLKEWTSNAPRKKGRDLQMRVGKREQLGKRGTWKFQGQGRQGVKRASSAGWFPGGGLCRWQNVGFSQRLLIFLQLTIQITVVTFIFIRSFSGFLGPVF